MSPHAAINRMVMKSKAAKSGFWFLVSRIADSSPTARNDKAILMSPQAYSLRPKAYDRTLVDGRGDDEADAQAHASYEHAEREVLLLIDLFPQVVRRDPVKDEEEDREDHDADERKGEGRKYVGEKVRGHVYLPP